jgi:glycolate oxidase
LRLPVVLALVGALEIFDPGAAASGARRRFVGAAHMLSSVSEPGLRKSPRPRRRAAHDQLYVRGGDTFVEDQVNRSIASGYRVRLTVDTAHCSRRERDIASVMFVVASAPPAATSRRA